MQSLLADAAAWCLEHNAVFHVGACKTVSMLSTSGGTTSALKCPLHFQSNSGLLSYLSHVESHCWLGVIWTNTLVFNSDMFSKLKIVLPVVSMLAGLLNGKALTLDCALQIFEVKVDSVLTTGRWLWSGSAETAEVLDSWYAKFARLLIGADP